jgi:hypothetical protein
MFNAVDLSGSVGQGTTVTGSGGLGMKVGYKHITSRQANPKKLAIGFDWIWNMAKNEAAPNHVKQFRCKWNLSDVPGNNINSVRRSEHLRIEIDSDRILYALNSPPNATSCIQQPFSGQSTEELLS